MPEKSLHMLGPTCIRISIKVHTSRHLTTDLAITPAAAATQMFVHMSTHNVQAYTLAYSHTYSYVHAHVRTHVVSHVHARPPRECFEACHCTTYHAHVRTHAASDCRPRRAQLLRPQGGEQDMPSARVSVCATHVTRRGASQHAAAFCAAPRHREACASPCA